MPEKPGNPEIDEAVDMEIASYSHVRTNRKVFEILDRDDLRGRKVVDIGAGEGYFCKMLGDYIKDQYAIPPGEIVRGCDLYPEACKYKEVPCDRIDANGTLPYGENSFDAACCIEVIEHIEDQFKLIRELYRIVKPGGRAIVTTPNLLNINSRIRFFYSGFGLLYNPLPLGSVHPVHLDGHIHPVTYYYLAYMFSRAGFRQVNVHFDRYKRSAMAWSLLLYAPLLLAYKLYEWKLARKNKAAYLENQNFLKQINRFGMIASRTLIIEGVK